MSDPKRSTAFASMGAMNRMQAIASIPINSCLILMRAHTRDTEATMLLVLNAHHDLVEFTLPPCAGGEQWSLELDTNVTIASRQAASGDVYGVTPRSLVLLRLVSD